MFQARKIAAAGTAGLIPSPELQVGESPLMILDPILLMIEIEVMIQLYWKPELLEKRENYSFLQ